MTQDSKKKPSSRASNILAEIEKQQLVPTSRYAFLMHDTFLWLCWMSSVIVGALAIAVLLMAWMEGMYGFYEATHATWLAYTLERMPYVWLFIFTAVVAIAYRNVRRTETGYKYPFWQVVLSSIGLSIVAGVLFYWLGLGYVTDKIMADHMPMYESQEQIDQASWQQPAEGRLVGSAKTTNALGLQFVDTANTTWTLITDELSAEEKSLLTTGEQVKVLGMQDDASTFLACGVMPVYEAADRGEGMPTAANELRLNLQKLKEYREMETVDDTAATSMRCMDLPLLENMP